MRSYYVPPAPATRPNAPVPTDPARKAEFDASRGQSMPPVGQPTPAPPPPPPAAAPAASKPYTPYSAPGYGEQFYKQHQGFWDQPGAASQYWNGVQGSFAQPGSGETALNHYGDQLGSTPGAMENLYNTYSSQGDFTNPGAAEKFWSDYGGSMMAPGRADEAFNSNLDMLKTPGAMEQLFPKLQAQLLGSGYTEKVAQNYRPETSYSEQFLTGGGATGGLDSVYDRLYSQGSKRIGDESAARGGYNSGASIRATEELNKDLTAQHVRDLQTASQTADTEKNNRLRYGLDLMRGADTSMVSRLGQLSTSGAAAQEGMLGRAGQTTSAATGLGNLINNRYKTGADASMNAETAKTGRLNAGTTAAHSAESDYMDRLAKAGGMKMDAQQLALNRMQTGGNLAAGAGTEETTRVTAGMNAAHTAETEKEGRESGVFNNLMSLAQSKAGTYSTMTSQQRSEELQLKMTEIQGKLDSGAISAAEAKQLRDMYTQMLAMPIAAAKAKPGAGGAGGTGTTPGYDPDAALPMRTT